MSHRQNAITLRHQEFLRLIDKNNGVECEKDPDLFFFEDELPTHMKPRVQANAAREICSQCPLSYECLEYALLADEPYGIWGGMTRKERVAISGSGRSAR